MLTVIFFPFSIQQSYNVCTFLYLQYSAKCPEGKDDRTAVKQILKIRKVLYCPKCDKELRNIQYYYKHYEWCGREVE